MNPIPPTSDSRALVEGRGLTVQEKGMDLHVDLDLSLAPGEVLGILGAPGTGKTALALCLAGVLPPAAGTLRMFGRDLSTLNAVDRERMLGELVGHLDGAAEVDTAPVDAAHGPLARVAEPLLRRGVEPALATAWARHTLEGLGVSALELARVRGSDTAVRRLVELARALVLAPAVLVVDEPTAGLRSADAARVLNALATAADRPGRAVVILSAHSRVLAAADRVLALGHGEVYAISA